MSDELGSIEPELFQRIYAANADPWQYETSPYEHAKYGATLAALPRARYQTALELGCSIGVLTQRLAARCRALLGVDVVEAALERARTRCGDQPHVALARHHLPADFPDGRFDLILVSEVGYYFNRADLAALLERIIQALSPAGHLLLVHWRPYVRHSPLTGDQVHDEVLRLSGDRLRPLDHRLRYLYRIDLLERLY